MNRPPSSTHLRDPAHVSRMRKILRKYIPPGLLPRVREAAGLNLDHIPNSEEVLTFLFADLVSFTSFAEQRTPDEIVRMLNLSIGATSSVIGYWGGTVNKFMGDSLFANFRDPLRAAIAAIEMQKQFQILNLMNMKDQSSEIKVRIGIHTGPCILASIGTDDYMDFTAIGDSVNVASRLEKACRPGAVLASMETVRAFQENLLASRPLTVEVKGKSEPIEACYIDRVRFHGPRGFVETGLDDELF